MTPHRIAWVIAFAALAVVAGLGTFGIAANLAEGETAKFAVASLGLELFLALVAVAGGLISRQSLATRLGLRPSRVPGGSLAWLVLGTLGLSHGLDGLLEISGLREHSALAEFDAALGGIRGRTLWIALLGVGLAPGVAEELLCRGLIQKGIEPALGPGPAVVVAALVFGMLHAEPILGGAAMVLGLYLGTVVVLAGSVRAAILCHVVNNLVSVSAAACLPEAHAPDPGTTLLGFAVAAGCLWAVWRKRGRGSAGPCLTN